MRLWFDPDPRQVYAPLVRKVDGVRERRCTVCGKFLPLDAAHFCRDNSNPLGFQYRCKACDRVRRRRAGAPGAPNNGRTTRVGLRNLP